MPDALFRRIHPAILLLAIALIAYLHASAVTTLVVDAYLGTAMPKARLEQKRPAPTKQTRSATLILARNPFDSITGPLNVEPDGPRSPRGEVPPDSSNPLVAPECGNLSAHAVTEFGDPRWSATILTDAHRPLGQTRHMGDSVGNRKVVFIGFNALKQSPSVWLTSGSTLCQVLLFTTATEPPSSDGPKPEKPPGGSSRGALPKSLSDRIKRVSATEIHIDRSAVEEILGDQAELMQAIRVRPEHRDGKVIGLRLTSVRPDSLLGNLGLQSDDRLETINGFDVASPERALEAYARIRTADELVVRVSRQGRPMSIVVRIR
jgi:general secretion pathway protein C